VRAAGLAWGVMLAVVQPSWAPPSADDVVSPVANVSRRTRLTVRLRVAGELQPVPGAALLWTPDGVRVDWLGPSGGALSSWVASGGQLAWRDPRQRTAWTASAADTVVRAATRGRVGLRDTLGFLVADPASLGERVSSRWRPDGGVTAEWRGVLPLRGVLDAEGRLTQASVVRRGRLAIAARWTWHGDELMGVEVALPSMDAVLSVAFVGWQPADVPDDALTLVPEGFQAARLETWPRR